MRNEMLKVGHYTFQNKEKDHTFYVIQVLTSRELEDSSVKSSFINCYVKPEDYAYLSALEFGSKIIVESTVNFETNKVSHKIIL